MITVKYESTNGQTFNLSEPPYVMNVENLFDYEWSYATRERRRGDIVAGFSKKISDTDIVLHIMSDSVVWRNSAIDNFNNAIETDIYNGNAGKLWVGEWFTYGYFVTSKNEKWQYDVPIMKKTLKFVREKASWFRITTRKSFESEIFTPTQSDFIKTYDDNYDYRYDYMTDFESSVSLNNPDALPSEFILDIQGEASRPLIQIGDNTIHFDVDIPQGAHLTVDSTNKTTIMTLADGSTINVFGARDPEYYIFERIPAGRSSTIWNGGFAWEIQLIEERSEPRWLTV